VAADGPPELKTIKARVPPEIHTRAEALARDVRPLGQPHAGVQDVIAALVYVATPETAAKALVKYNPLLGRFLNEIDDAQGDT
jgi:hypothetical protein